MLSAQQCSGNFPGNVNRHISWLLFDFPYMATTTYCLLSYSIRLRRIMESSSTEPACLLPRTHHLHARYLHILTFFNILFGYYVRLKT
ncbi:hypothetical protein F5B17DRAFT_400133 [Nemania serpens]|nr:hypothetical protein F5B17DRAFT_400133 [Nemania serpens]